MGLRIILIYGTWSPLFGRIRNCARRFLGRIVSTEPFWFEDKSSFRKTLSDELTGRAYAHEFAEIFEWSGQNSVRERYFAADKLMLRVMREQRAHPNDQILMICHSHGGNIALLCLVLLKKFDFPIRLSIVTIATPFLLVRKLVSDDPRLGAYARADSVFFWSFVVLFVSTAVLFLAKDLIPTLPGSASDLALPMAIFGIFACFTLVFPFVNTLTGYNPSRLLLTDQTIALQHQANLLKQADTAPHLRLPARMLVLRGADDEAAIILMLGSLVSRLLHLSTILVGKYALVSVGVWPILVAALFSGYMDFLFDHPVARFLLVLCSYGLAMASPLFCLMLILANSAKRVYGKEFGFKSACIDVTAQTTPDGRSNIIVESVAPADNSGSSLIHFLYQNPDCARAIGKSADFLAGV